MLHTARVVLMQPGVPLEKVHHTLLGLEVGTGRRQYHAAAGRAGDQLVCKLEQRGDPRRRFGRRRQRRYDRHPVVIALYDYRFVCEFGIPPRYAAPDIPGRPALPVHTSL